MSDVRLRRLRSMVHVFSESMSNQELSQEQENELNRIKCLADSSNEFEDLPKIYTHRNMVSFKVVSSEAQSKYDCILDQAKGMVRPQ